MFTLLKVLGIGLLLFTLLMTWRTRGDLQREETQWGRALFYQSKPLRRSESPLRYWLATALNVAVVILFTLAAVFMLRAGVLHLGAK